MNFKGDQSKEISAVAFVNLKKELEVSSEKGINMLFIEHKLLVDTSIRKSVAFVQ